MSGANTWFADATNSTDSGTALRSPTTSFEELVREMVESDYTSAKRDSMVKLAGFQAYDYHE